MAITKEQDRARPTGTLGVERWVQFAYAACAITLAWFLIKVTDATWTLLADTIDAVPEPNGTVIAVGAGLVAFITAVATYRSTALAPALDSRHVGHGPFARLDVLPLEHLQSLPQSLD